VEIAPHLIGIVSTPIASLSHKGRAVKRAKGLRLAEETARWRTCSDCKGERAEKTAEQLERAYPGISKLWHGSSS
jgi:hypothetical protein